MKKEELQDGKYYWIKWDAKEDWKIARYDKAKHRLKNTWGAHMEPERCLEINNMPIRCFFHSEAEEPSETGQYELWREVINILDTVSASEHEVLNDKIIAIWKDKFKVLRHYSNHK